MNEREYTIKKTLGRLKNDVKNDIDINSARIYQSIRTLSEYVLKITLESLNDKFLVENKNITMHDMFYHLNDNYSFNFDTGKYYKEIIRQRNLKEHSPEKFNPEIDHKKIKEIVFFYNDLSKALCEISSCKDNLFRINEDVFYDKPPVVIDETHTSGEMNSRETKAIFEKRRLEKKLDDMEKVEGNSTEKNRRKIRSERLTIENHIKMNDGKLMSIYMFKNKNKRKPISLKKEAMRFFIGLSEKDYGFAVEGLEASGRCDHPYAHIYSVIYNLLLRNKIYRPTSFLKQNERNQGIKINYANVVKYQIMFLLLVKNNYCNQDILSFKLENGNQNEFLIAIKDILNYASTVARLSASDFTAPPIKISEDGIGISIGTHPDASAYCTDLLECDRNCKSTSWIEPGLQFSINAGNKIDMEFILENAFGFKTFKKGQFETICNILNSDASSICIMPTASGKSLIYYFYSIMTSMPTIIVSPTKLLIEDQIRNLNQIHGYYSCTGLDENLDYSDYSFEHMLNFATPEIFMNQTFTDRVSQIISSGKIKTIVLDEIHCASNWSHDYRPAYLMLSKYISASMPNVRILGFTATTSYLITKDIMRQYSISKENIYEPISLTREDIHLSFHGYPDVNEIIEGLESSFIQNNFARSIVFTKNSDMTKVVYQKLKPSIQIKCDCFTDSSLDSYYDFVNGNIDIMIANNQMGIGVNMPDIVNSYHIGFPLSKNHFIQEAGRIARNGLHGEASIIFNSLSNLGYTEKKLLDISTPVEELVEVINMSNTNYSDILNSFKNIMGHVEDPHSCIKNLKSIYGSFPSEEKHIGLFVYNDEESRYAMDRKNIHAQTYLLTLKNMGIIKEWYIHSTALR